MRERLKQLHQELIIAENNKDHKQVVRLIGEINYEKYKQSLMRWVWYR